MLCIKKNFHKFGIIAYGSLISDPGVELDKLIRERKNILTPFKVEFKRKSLTRGDAPTLIPVKEGGRRVKAQLFILDNKLTETLIESVLWNRERHLVGSNEEYTEPSIPNQNSIIIKVLIDFKGVHKVFYTQIGQNIPEPVTGKVLAELAIKSISGQAGKEKKDGLRYLNSITKSGVATDLTDEYLIEILKATGARDLDQAINILDKKRDNLI